MKYQIFSDNEWIYPDTSITEENKAELYSARGADVCFQVLTDCFLNEEAKITVAAEGMPDGCEAIVYQLTEAHVGENSARTVFTTKDYDSVKDFGTRKAPFDVYEITRPLEKGKLSQGRLAFYLRINVAADAAVGVHTFQITLTVGEEAINLPVTLQIFNTCIPPLKKAGFHMINWLYYDEIAKDHRVELWSEEYFDVLRAYLENQLDMRNDYLMLPSGMPIYDENGVVQDFDFAPAEKVGNLALSMGFKYIQGGFVARFEVWDDPEHLLLWDRKVGTTTLEGYRQLKCYFTRAWECVCKNNWQQVYMQCLVDEPQFPNSLAYRALSGICRKCMPGVTVYDPVETTDIEGAVDVWCVKQAVYEKYIDTYRALQDLGEEIWLYTCGFPAGWTMNRVIDLPLSVSRLPFWMCCKYGAKGFLHWGYHKHNEEREKETCYRIENGYYPAGNSFVVYLGEKGPMYSVRGHLQRSGAYDAELFLQLSRREGGRQQMLSLIDRVCRSFDEYDSSSALLDEVRRDLLMMLG